MSDRQAGHRCHFCKRVFRHGDYMAFVLKRWSLWTWLRCRFRRPRYRSCEACMPYAHKILQIGTFRLGEISSVSKDREMRRQKKLKRAAKRAAKEIERE